MSVLIRAYLDGGKSECGYRFVVTRDFTSWTAFRTVKGLKYFLEGYGLKIDTSKTELHDCRVIGKGRYITMACHPKKIDSKYFWSLDEVPVGTKPFFSIVNGNYVQCYILDKGQKVIVYKPNPNAPMVYVPYDHQAMRNLIG